MRVRWATLATAVLVLGLAGCGTTKQLPGNRITGDHPDGLRGRA